MNVFYKSICLLIESVYRICGDYGIAIVVITVLIRLCMIPLNRKQKRALKQQQTLNLQVAEIKRKYKDNVTKMNKELEMLYQKQGTGSLGCLLAFLQFPIMIVLYNGIRLAVTANVGTVLLPWVSSLLIRDSTYILPVITVLVQMIPQILPYIKFFEDLNLPKTGVPMAMILVLTNGWFACMIPAGVELYYMVSGLFTAVEQIIGYSRDVKKVKTA